jgi:hypothetical protein
MRNNIMHRFLLYLILAGALFCVTGLAQDQTQPSDTNPASPPHNTPTDQQSARVPGTTPSQQMENQQTPSQSTTPAQPTATTGTQTPRIAPGSVIPVELTKTVDAKKAKSGEEVVAKVTQDLKSTSGEIIVPKDTKVIGHVTEAQARSKDQKSSELGIAFDHAVTKDGEQMQMPMSIQAIIAPPKSNASNSGGGGYAEPTPQGANQNTGASAPGGRAGMGGSAQQPTSSSAPMPTGGNPPDQQSSSGKSLPPITGQTQGVIGISDVSLAPAANAAQGSVVSSGKNNVKLEDGTFMLLRVNQ